MHAWSNACVEECMRGVMHAIERMKIHVDLMKYNITSLNAYEALKLIEKLTKGYTHNNICIIVNNRSRHAGVHRSTSG